MTDSPYIFDGHNDLLSQMWTKGATPEDFARGLPGAIDLPRATAGGYGGAFFACWVPSPDDQPLEALFALMRQPSYDIPLPPTVPQDAAMKVVLEQAAILQALDQAGHLRLCRTVADIGAARAAGQIAAIFHIEGAECIDPDLAALDRLHGMGLRSLGPVWSRDTIFAHGVPFRFPGSPDTGPGLTEAGVRLVQRCDALGIMLDLSHLNEAGFWDVARHSTKPLVATHSNAHALCEHTRNLTDAQLDAIAASDGMVGLNFAVSFLRADGRKIGDTPISDMLRHLDHLLHRLGEDRVGLGSDYDGAMVPDALPHVGCLPDLRRALSQHGYGETLITKLCHGNWLRVLDRAWSA